MLTQGIIIQQVIYLKRTILILLLTFMQFHIFSDTAPVVDFYIGEWEPFTGKYMKNGGLITAIVSEACRNSGINSKFKFYPWKRAEFSVERGESFATFPYQETNERKEMYLFSETIYTSSMAILYLKKRTSSIDLKHIRKEDFRNIRAGIIYGTDAVKHELEKLGAVVEEVQDVSQNFKKLEENRIDIIIDDVLVIKYSIAKLYGSDTLKFEFSDKSFGNKANYKLMVSKKYPNSVQLLTKFNAGIRTIISNGTYNRIIRDYSETPPFSKNKLRL